MIYITVTTLDFQDTFQIYHTVFQGNKEKQMHQHTNAQCVQFG